MKNKTPILIAIAIGVATYFGVDENMLLDILGKTENTKTQIEVTEMTTDTRVIFFDIGQGDASLIIAGDDAVLIDAGTNSTQKEMVDMINSYGVYQLDLIIATHPHEDHIGGIDYVINGMPVDALLMVDKPYNSITYSDVLQACEDTGVPILDPFEHDLFIFDSGLVVEVINPPETFQASDTNDDSIVCYVHIGETTILYTGDMEQALEAVLLDSFEDVDMLKSGHHGSITSSTEAFLDKIKAEIVVISCGYQNRYGHPHEDVIARYNARNMEIYRTDEMGDVIFDF